MKVWKRAVVQTPVVGSIVLLIWRAKLALSYYYKPLADLLRWLVNSNETTNFTYDLEKTNRRYLAAMLSHVLDCEYSTILGYLDEADGDAELKKHIADQTAQNSLSTFADRDVKFGRRLGWYAVVRASKPRVVIETGVDKGLGACLLTAALMRNSEEGHDGRYYGTDIDPEAGYLLTGKYAEFGQVLYGDSIETLTALDVSVDILVNDSDHSAEYEGAEYEVLARKFSDRSIILGDNCHVTDKLLEFSLKRGRKFLYFGERPLNHWYPGGGIGISFVKAEQ